jgi:hypothetical protein
MAQQKTPVKKAKKSAPKKPAAAKKPPKAPDVKARAKAKPAPATALKAAPKAKASPLLTKEARRAAVTLSRADLNYFRNLLLEKRREILGDVGSMESEAFKSGSNLSNMPIHMADVGTDNFEQEFTPARSSSMRAPPMMRNPAPAATTKKTDPAHLPPCAPGWPDSLPAPTPPGVRQPMETHSP